MAPHRLAPAALFRCPGVLALAWVAACAASDDFRGEVEGEQVDGVWVFAYAEDPDSEMQALHGGDVAVVDGCLQVGDAVVVWHDHHLADVEAFLQSVEIGETVTIELGGGGFSLDEGGTVDDFPDAVLEHCSPNVIWYSATPSPTVGAER